MASSGGTSRDDTESLFRLRQETLVPLAQRDPYRHPPNERTWWDWREIERRQDPEAHRVWDDPLLDAMEPELAKHRMTTRRRESLMLLRAVRLAPDLETAEELLRTGKAPKSRLDSEWAKAYGI